jgi:hypothetical protein
MAAFEIHMLARDGAEKNYSADVCAEAQVWFENSTAQSRDTLLASIMAGSSRQPKTLEFGCVCTQTTHHVIFWLATDCHQ